MGWKRVGGLAHLLFSTVLLVGGALLACAFVAAIAVAGWHVWAVFLLLGAAAFVAFACRLLMTGVFVNDTGVRVRSLTRTLGFSWSAVLAVRSTKIILSSGEHPVTFDARQVTFDLSDGQTIDTPLHGMPPGESRHLRMPAVLSATQFDRVLADLRHLASVHQTSPDGDRPVG